MLYVEVILSQVFDFLVTMHHVRPSMVLGSANVGGGSTYAVSGQTDCARTEESCRDLIMKYCLLYVGY
jgi:hypothetical protein